VGRQVKSPTIEKFAR